MESMSPSETITPGQIGKIQELLGAGLRKAGLQKDPTQLMIKIQGASLVEELVAVVCKRVKAASNIIVRRAKVNRGLSPLEVLRSLNCGRSYSLSAVNSMPRGKGKETEIFFFQVGRRVNNEGSLEKEYSLRGLVPADPYSLAAVNGDDPTFRADHPNCTHWKDSAGDWCYMSFTNSNGVEVNHRMATAGWNASWWFAGIRK